MKTIHAKLIVAAVCSLLALLLPFVILTTDQATWAVRYLGYWIILGLVLHFLLLLRRRSKGTTTAKIILYCRENWGGLLVIALATAYLQVHEQHEFKILYDEYTLNSVARNLHFNREACVQDVLHRINGEPVSLAGFVDKRPILFPFAVSVLHELTGYRPANAFLLNFLLSGILLFLLYEFTRRATGPGYGILSVLLMTSLPLMAQNATSGGYELLNLCLVCALLITGTNYLRAQDTGGLHLMILSAILLANTRYESILFTCVPVVLVLLKTLRTKKLSLTWAAALSPAYLALPLLSIRIFHSGKHFFQTDESNFFNLRHLAPNLRQALVYLFDFSGSYSNSLILSILGPVCLLLLGVHVLRRQQPVIHEDHHLPVFCAAFLFMAANLVLILCCFWGAWTDPVTSRFSLPLHLFMVLAVPLTLYHGFAMTRMPPWLPAGVLVFMVGVTGHVTARMAKRTDLQICEIDNWTFDYIFNNIRDGKDSLFILDASIGLGLYHYPCIAIKVANASPEKVLFTRKIGVYKEIYAVQMIEKDNQSGRENDITRIRFSPRFRLEPVAEKRIDTNLFCRISRVIGLNPPVPGQETKPENLPPPPLAENATRKDYIRHLYQSLPILPE